MKKELITSPRPSYIPKPVILFKEGELVRAFVNRAGTDLPLGVNVCSGENDYRGNLSDIWLTDVDFVVDTEKIASNSHKGLFAWLGGRVISPFDFLPEDEITLVTFQYESATASFNCVSTGKKVHTAEWVHFRRAGPDKFIKAIGVNLY